MDGAEPRWLTEAEQRAWRAYLVGVKKLESALDRELEDHGLTLSEYDVLAWLSEAEGRSMRMSQLAESVVQSRSRLTHTANRLEKRGLVERDQCPDDRRGVWLKITPRGMTMLSGAAVAHVTSVRRHLTDLMTEQEFLLLGDLMTRVSRHAL